MLYVLIIPHAVLLVLPAGVLFLVLRRGAFACRSRMACGGDGMTWNGPGWNGMPGEQALFLWIVQAINKSLGKGEESLPFIGVLDIFGGCGVGGACRAAPSFGRHMCIAVCYIQNGGCCCHGQDHRWRCRPRVDGGVAA